MVTHKNSDEHPNTVGRRTEHKPSSPGGAILMFERTGTSTTGDRHDGVVPDHVDSTTGHPLS